MTELGAELGELPYPKPRNYEERVANNEVWGEIFNGQPPRIGEYIIFICVLLYWYNSVRLMNEFDLPMIKRQKTNFQKLNLNDGQVYISQ